MAAYVQFLSRETGKPEAFQKIDDALCDAFGVAPHPTEWFCNWYNHLAFKAALGLSFAKIEKEIEAYADDATTDQEIAEVVRLIEIVRWLDAHYTTDAWSGR